MLHNMQFRNKSKVGTVENLFRFTLQQFNVAKKSNRRFFIIVK